MTANLFGDRFYSLREPAWHKLGIVAQEPMSAEKALETMGNYRVYVEGVHSDSGFILPLKAILRGPTKDDPATRYFGYSGPEYTLITPHDVAMIWDESVGVPVETVGALGKGETFFVSCKLPDMNIAGEKVDNYMLFVSPMTGWEAAQLRITPVRVVCQNTLNAAKSMSTEVYKMVHNQHLKDTMRSWLVGIYDRAVERSQALEEAFKVFADMEIEKEGVEEVLQFTYEYPNRPQRNVPTNVYERRMKDYEYYCSQIDTRREAVMTLFNGKMTGYDSPAVKGTPWGLYNAVVEFEDYRPNGGKIKSAAASAILGDRAEIKERAFVKLAELCGVEK